MKKTLALLLLGTAAAYPAMPAAAQTVDDVVVMRRVLTPPNKIAANTGDYKPLPDTDTSKPYWAVTPWLLGEPACTDTANATRGVVCIEGGAQVADSHCTGTKPTATLITGDYRKCDYKWTSEPSGDWAATCSTTTRPLSAQCIRQGTNETVADDFCSTAKPVTETGFNPAGCTFRWVPGEWKNWASQCSDSTTRMRDATCLRSDNTQAPETSCTDDKPPLTETGANHAGCTYEWVPSAWTPVNPGCGTDVPLTRTFSCKTNDGASDDDTMCGPKPPTEMNGEDYSGCTYKWTPGEWGEWSSQCSKNARHTREVTCIRSDSTSADPSNCKGVKDPTEEVVENVTGCTFDWKYSDWTPESGCSATTSQTRTAVCQRSDQTVAENPDSCTKPKDALSQSVAVYSSCRYRWSADAYVYDSTCSNAAVGTRNVTCLRLDGNDTPVDVNNANFCDQANRPAAQTTPQVQTSGCAVSWQYGEYTPWSSLCSANANRTRTATCYRALPAPDGPTPVNASDCSALPKGPTSETLPNYSSCAAFWDYGDWGWAGVKDAKSSTCSAAPQQTRTATCSKLDVTGTKKAAPGECGALPSTVSQGLNADYSGCTYDWNIPAGDVTTGWQAWSPSCSNASYRSRTVTCLRSDGANAPNDSYCTRTKPTSTEGPTTQVSGCSNMLSNAGFEGASPVKASSPANGVWYWSLDNPYTSNPATTTDAFSGSKAVSMGYNNSNSSFQLKQNIFVPKKGTYNFTMSCKASTGGTTVQVWLTDPSGGNISQSISCGTSWTLVNVSFNLTTGTWTSGAGRLSVYQIGGNGRTTTVDDLFLYTF